jgi:hypothetical protein
MIRVLLCFLIFSFSSGSPVNTGSLKNLAITIKDYEDKVHAIWLAQMSAALIAWPYEHKVASVQWLDDYSIPRQVAPVDDDWYYEMIAIRAFEKYGPEMTVQQLGQHWLKNKVGTWGSSEQARLAMEKGVQPKDAGHPRYNSLWFTIGPQFSAEVYGAIAPGMPNLAGKIARELCHINGYAEGADGGVFVAAMVSLGFSETNPKSIVRKAAKLIDPKSPYRKCLDMVISLADQGKSAQEIFTSVEEHWRIEYPASNNAVPNGGIVATSLWFGEGDFLKTVNLAAGAADFSDADCNAANAAAVVAAIHGMKAIPTHLVKAFNDRLKGEKMGPLALFPPVDEKISDLAKRTAAVGKTIMLINGVSLKDEILQIPIQEPVTQPAELFKLSDLTQYWNKDWHLERAGFGGGTGGMRIRGNTFLDNDILATYPRDEVKAVQLKRILRINGEKELSFDVGSDAQRSWILNVYVNNKVLLVKTISGDDKNKVWENIRIDLSDYQNQEIVIRLYQKVIVRGKESGNAYWKNIVIK